MRKSLKILLLILTLYSTTAFADFAPYNLLVPNLPGFKDAVTFPDYIPLAFNLAIGIGAGLAFVMITLGGITYATSDAITGKQSGREMITNAIYGLVLIVSAYAILWTINPKMLTLELTIPIPAIKPATGTGTGTLGAGITAGTNNVVGNVKGVPMTSAQIAADAEVRAALSSGNSPYKVSAYRGPCLEGQTTNCVNLNGLSGNIVTSLKTLALDCKCSISITGGTEAGHTTGSAHNAGKAVDIEADGILKMVVPPPQIPKPCGVYTYQRGGFMWEPKGYKCGGEVPSTGNHWHVQY